MKILSAVIMLLALCGVPAAVQSAPVIVGASGECDTTLPSCVPFPTNSSLLCDGTGAILDCPQYASPDYADTTGLRFFGITNRTNPPRCVKSVNGGTTWGLCDSGTVSPFSGALDALSNFAVASNGALLAAADQGANNCIIRRSIDYGVSWTTVFTDSVTVNVSCGLAFANPQPNTLRCASASPYCVMVAFISGTFDLLAYYSNDYGVSWTKGTVFNIVSADQEIGVAVGATGIGSVAHYGVTYNSANQKFASTSSGDFTLDGVIPLPTGEVAGTNSRCGMGAVVLGTTPGMFCGPATTLNTTYHYFTHGSGSTSSVANVIPPNGLTSVQAPDFMAVGYSGSTLYVVGRNVAGTAVNIWVTRDTFNTVSQIGTLTPTTALIGGCCRGDIFAWRGKVYFTAGTGGNNGFFGIIQ